MSQQREEERNQRGSLNSQSLQMEVFFLAALISRLSLERFIYSVGVKAMSALSD